MRSEIRIPADNRIIHEGVLADFIRVGLAGKDISGYAVANPAATTVVRPNGIIVHNVNYERPASPLHISGVVRPQGAAKPMGLKSLLN